MHGDYRLDNCLLDPDAPGRIRAVLDWEMSTLGDPLTDIGMLFIYWPEAGEDPAAVQSPVTALPGFPTRREIAERYAQRSGVYLDDLSWYVGFAFFKFAAIVAGIVARSAGGRHGRQGHQRLRRADRRLRRARTRRAGRRCDLARRVTPRLRPVGLEQR